MTQVAHQFDDFQQQALASRLGMWAFLASEVMFFGGLFLGYTAYRTAYPHAFIQASHELYMWIGATNAGILLVSSLTMALATLAAGVDARRATWILLTITAVLGLCFLGLKGYEYYKDWSDGIIPVFSFHAERFPNPHTRGHIEMFFTFYCIMTALHTIHLMCGIGAVGYTAVRSYHGAYSTDNHNTIENVGLYWAFVDIVWIFLFPLLYLPGVY